MNVVITGGVGFIGTNLAKRLLADGHKVIVLDDYSVGKVENQIEGVKYIPMNIEQINYMSGNEVDICFHLAALSRIQPSFENPSEFFRVNTSGTEAICEWARKGNVKVVYAGSSSQWHDPFQSPYAMYKKLGEDVCKMYKKVFATNIEIARFYNVYGPNEITEGDWAAVIGKWRGQVEKNHPITIVGDGEQRRDFTHVDDIVDALVLIMEKEAYGYEFELGKGKNISVNEVSQMFNITPIYKDSKPGEARDTLNKDSTTKTILGWNPQKELVDYIKELN